MIDLVKTQSQQLTELCRQYNVKYMGLFGSALDEKDFDPQRSDIDFLVEFLPLKPSQHAKSYFGLLEKLQDLFGRNIDLVEINAIKNPYLMESVDKSRIQIYAA